MVEKYPVPGSGEIALALLGKDIPAMGPRLKTKREAVSAAKKYISAIEGLVKYTGRPYSVIFSRQPDGKYALQIHGSGKSIEILYNLDEVTVKRFQRRFKNKIFIITCFFEEDDRLECLALTEGMGAVMYVPR